MKLAAELYTIPEILNAGVKNFEIKSYQRGYRWDIDNIEQFINDVVDSDPNKTYCMQPLVVTELNETTFEVIDGQQRLTTFKILVHCLKFLTGKSSIEDYKIKYETRSCETFLEKIYSNKLECNLSVLKLENVRELWNMLELEKEEINRDNFHLYQSYCACIYILNNLDKEDLENLINKLTNSVKFIWYEVDLKILNTTAEKLFSNINKNKIKLTGADLIKALLILDIEKRNDINVEVKHYEKQTLSNEWNEVEQMLGDSDFWFFITNTKEQNYDVRIGKLFDILTGNAQETDLGSYFIMVKNPEKRNWSLVYESFKIAQEWYDDYNLYHRIGFLVNMNIESFNTILLEYNKKTLLSKKVFENWIDTLIKTYLNKIDILDLDYNKHKGRFGYCTGYLILYNILLLEKFYPHQKFSFGDLVEQEWSLEHIQPQKPKDKNPSAWVVWLKEIEVSISDKFISEDQKIIIVDRNQYGIDEINFEFLLENLKDETIVSRNLLVQLEILQNIFEEEFPSHKLQNLALLDKITNSRLSNNSFKEKRKLILQFNQQEGDEKVYLPLGTINVFSKSMVSSTEKLQLEYWSNSDSEFYLSEIKNILKPYTDDK